MYMYDTQFLYIPSRRPLLQLVDKLYQVAQQQLLVVSFLLSESTQ